MRKVRTRQYRGSFDPQLANHASAPNKPRKKAKRNSPQSKSAKRREKARKRIAILRQMPYPKYLNSAHWKRKRLRKLEEVGHKCENCGGGKYLQVHHKTYERRGCELMTDLQALCRDCHSVHHEGEKPGIMDSVTSEFVGMFRQ